MVNMVMVIMKTKEQ